ncbi:MAG: hemerythrin domain-containing protein [Candidatus Marsarchaeota archaeon]|jgi:hemerythrin-like domain-containing protein|nr:hemerythrin domain-containing protein [Candidatus Marsarchaeota archaeon]
MQVTEFMDKDHAAMEKLFASLVARGKDRQNLRDRFAQFRVRMERHMAWEEDVLFKIVEQKTGGQSILVEELTTQHARIKELLAGIAKAIDDGTPFGVLRDDLDAVMSAHEKMEDSSLYPWLDQTLSAGERDSAIAYMKSLGKHQQG